MDLKRRYSVRGETVYTEAQVQHRIQQALGTMQPKEPSMREMFGKVIQHLGISELNSPSTPSSNWSKQGEPDYHPDLIDKERGELMMGSYTDDELANAVFMYGNPSDREKHERLMKGEIMDIAYLTAGKERIRWLSRHLEKALAANAALERRVKELEANQ